MCISKRLRVHFGFNFVVSESLNCFPSSGLCVQYLPHSRTKKKKWCCVVFIMFQPGNNFFVENITNSTIYFSKFLDKDFDNGVEFYHDIVLFLHSAILFYHSISQATLTWIRIHNFVCATFFGYLLVPQVFHQVSRVVNCHERWKMIIWYCIFNCVFVGNKAKERISKRVFQEKQSTPIKQIDH